MNWLVYEPRAFGRLLTTYFLCCVLPLPIIHTLAGTHRANVGAALPNLSAPLYRTMTCSYPLCPNLPPTYLGLLPLTLHSYPTACLHRYDRHTRRCYIFSWILLLVTGILSLPFTPLQRHRCPGPGLRIYHLPAMRVPHLPLATLKNSCFSLYLPTQGGRHTACPLLYLASSDIL